MKKIIYLVAIVTVFFTSCDPMEDIYNDIDAQEKPVVGNANYTLTDDDYETLELNYGSFSSIDDMKAEIPAFLADKYPHWGKGSSVLLGYNLYQGNYESFDSYELAVTDYLHSDVYANGFYPGEDATNEIPGILENQFADASEDDNVIVSYNDFVNVPIVGVTEIINADFTANSGTLLDFTATSVVGDNHVWEASSYGAKISGSSYPDYFVNEDWLISSEIDLTNETNLSFQITQILRYSNASDYYNIVVAKDYTGDIATATWENIDVSPVPPGDSWAAITSDDYDFSAYEGETIHIAFKYESDLTIGATWEIVNFAIKATGVTGDSVSKKLYYTFSAGAWVVSEGYYATNDADYTSMGVIFGSAENTVKPNDYLPTFLNIKYPYAQENDNIFILYDYLSGSSGQQVRGNLYTLTNNVWEAYESTIEKSFQFGHNGIVWEPDNTIRYALMSADYSFAGTELDGVVDGDIDYTAAAGNLSSYGNFNRQGSSSSWTDEMVVKALGLILDNNFPSAAIGQKYLVTFSMYNGAGGTEDFHLIKNSDSQWKLL